MRCDVCKEDVEEFVSCSQCGKVYCKRCLKTDRSMSSLGMCDDCEETWEAEEDLQAMEEDW